MIEQLIKDGFEPIIDNVNYLINRYGVIFSIDKKKFINRPMGGDYVVVRVNKKSHRLHVLVAKQFIPNPLNKPLVNHIDANKKNNHVSNLEWATNSENSAHAHKFYKQNNALYNRWLNIDEASEVYNFLKTTKKRAYGKAYEKFKLAPKTLERVKTLFEYSPNKEYSCLACSTPAITRIYNTELQPNQEVMLVRWDNCIRDKDFGEIFKALKLRLPCRAIVKINQSTGRMEFHTNNGIDYFWPTKTFNYWTTPINGKKKLKQHGHQQ